MPSNVILLSYMLLGQTTACDILFCDILFYCHSVLLISLLTYCYVNITLFTLLTFINISLSIYLFIYLFIYNLIILTYAYVHNNEFFIVFLFVLCFYMKSCYMKGIGSVKHRRFL